MRTNTWIVLRRKDQTKQLKTVRIGYTVTCVTTSVRNKLHLENIQTQNMTKVKNVMSVENHLLVRTYLKITKF